MLGDLRRGKSQTALAWGLRGRFHQCPKRDKNGDNDPGLGAQGFGCLHPTRLHPWVCLQESPWPHPRQHLRPLQKIAVPPPGLGTEWAGIRAP